MREDAWLNSLNSDTWRCQASEKQTASRTALMKSYKNTVLADILIVHECHVLTDAFIRDVINI